MKPITTFGEVSSIIKRILSGIQRIANNTVAFSQIFGIFSFFSLGISSKAWFLETKGKIGEIRKRYTKFKIPIMGAWASP